MTYAIVDKEDGLLDVVDTTGEEALDYAASLKRGDAWFDGPEEWLEGGEALPLAANKSHSAMKRDPELALAKANLEPVSLDEILAEYPKRHMDRTDFQDPGLIAAHDAIRPFFPTTKETRGVANEVKQWQSPKGMVEALLAQNAKMEKRLGEGMPRYLERQLEGMPPPSAYGLALAPHSMPFNAKLPERASVAEKYQLKVPGTFCLRKTKECGASCLVYSGQNNLDRYNYIIKFAKSRALLEQPLAFCRVLIDAVGRHARREHVWPFCRLNVFSDIPWELFFPDIFRLYPEMWFYDYTKVPGRQPVENGVDNYDLTFSYSGRNKEEMIFELTEMNRRVAVVFATEKHVLPRFAWDIPVVDADISDFRPLDPPNPGTGSPKPVVVGLAYKDPLGNMHAKQMQSLNVFVVPCSVESDGNVIIHEVPGQTDIHNLSEYHSRKLRRAKIKRRLYLV